MTNQIYATIKVENGWQFILPQSIIDKRFIFISSLKIANCSDSSHDTSNLDIFY